MQEDFSFAELAMLAGDQPGAWLVERMTGIPAPELSSRALRLAGTSSLLLRELADAQPTGLHLAPAAAAMNEIFRTLTQSTFLRAQPDAPVFSARVLESESNRCIVSSLGFGLFRVMFTGMEAPTEEIIGEIRTAALARGVDGVTHTNEVSHP